jgi:hypothetical protein
MPGVIAVIAAYSVFARGRRHSSTHARNRQRFDAPIHQQRKFASAAGLLLSAARLHKAGHLYLKYHPGLRSRRLSRRFSGDCDDEG